jgi:hypothetical protein
MNLLKIGMLAASLATPALADGKNPELPRYKPGHCVQDYRYHEPWRNEPQILFIVRSGNYHYLLVPWFSDVKQYGHPFEELIPTVNQYKRTLCPAGYPEANLPKR